MLKIRRHNNITHTAVALVDDSEKTAKRNIAKFVAINAGVVVAVVAAKVVVSKVLSSDNENN